MAKEKLSLGDSLVAEGVITAEQLKKAEEESKRVNQRLNKALVRLGYGTPHYETEALVAGVLGGG